MANNKISALTSASTPLAGTETLPIVQSGATVNVAVSNLTLGRAVNTAGGTFTDNQIQGTAAKGINFTANTPAAGMTSQLLNLYEEGTWTGTLVGGTTSPTIPVTATGRYVRVGKQVTFNIGFINVSTIGALGNVTVTGLPFTSLVRSVHATATYSFDLNTGTSVISQVDVGATTLFVLASKTNAAWALVQHSAGTGRYLTISGSYITA